MVQSDSVDQFDVVFIPRFGVWFWQIRLQPNNIIDTWNKFINSDLIDRCLIDFQLVHSFLCSEIFILLVLSEIRNRRLEGVTPSEDTSSHPVIYLCFLKLKG